MSQQAVQRDDLSPAEVHAIVQAELADEPVHLPGIRLAQRPKLGAVERGRGFKPSHTPITRHISADEVIDAYAANAGLTKAVYRNRREKMENAMRYFWRMQGHEGSAIFATSRTQMIRAIWPHERRRSDDALINSHSKSLDFVLDALRKSGYVWIAGTTDSTGAWWRTHVELLDPTDKTRTPWHSCERNANLLALEAARQLRQRRLKLAASAELQGTQMALPVFAPLLATSRQFERNPTSPLRGSGRNLALGPVLAARERARAANASAAGIGGDRVASSSPESTPAQRAATSALLGQGNGSENGGAPAASRVVSAGSWVASELAALEARVPARDVQLGALEAGGRATYDELAEAFELVLGYEGRHSTASSRRRLVEAVRRYERYAPVLVAAQQLGPETPMQFLVGELRRQHGSSPISPTLAIRALERESKRIRAAAIALRPEQAAARTRRLTLRRLRRATKPGLHLTLKAPRLDAIERELAELEGLQRMADVGAVDAGELARRRRAVEKRRRHLEEMAALAAIREERACLARA